MNFQYKVKKTNEVDSPIYDLTIYVGSKFISKEILNDVDVEIPMVKIATDLVLPKSNGYTKVYSEYDYPDSVLGTINGFDVETMLPTVSTTALNQILASFNLKLAD